MEPTSMNLKVKKKMRILFPFCQLRTSSQVHIILKKVCQVPVQEIPADIHGSLACRRQLDILVSSKETLYLVKMTLRYLQLNLKASLSHFSANILILF